MEEHTTEIDFPVSVSFCEQVIESRTLAKVTISILLLGIILAAVCWPAGYFATQRSGQPAFGASALAAGLVWVSGSLAMLIMLRSKSDLAGVTAVLAAMLIRISLPLCAAVLLARPGSELAGAGFLGLVVVHYLVALVVETALSLRWFSQQKQASPQV